jgi:hypothetical protein
VVIEVSQLAEAETGDNKTPARRKTANKPQINFFMKPSLLQIK